MRRKLATCSKATLCCIHASCRSASRLIMQTIPQAHSALSSGPSQITISNTTPGF
jgi:hypothetical protein